MQTYRTVLERKIKERRHTLEEFAEFAEVFARENGEPGTLSLRHLQRLVAGRGPGGRPLGPVRPATARLLEAIFALSIDDLLASPIDVASTGTADHRQPDASSDLRPAFRWLDERAQWTDGTTQRKVSTRAATMDTSVLLDRQVWRAKSGRSRLSDALARYYSAAVPGYGTYRTQRAGRDVGTTILTKPEWLDLACSLTAESDRIEWDQVGISSAEDSGLNLDRAIERLVEAVALNVRLADGPVYRLLDVDIRPGSIRGRVGMAPFTEYALTVDLLEAELADAMTADRSVQEGELPLRDRYLPDLAAALDVGGRLCAGGVVTLCAVARPADPYRGPADFALLVQERSSHVVNGAQRLSVIPKGFHAPLKDMRADARIRSTLLREMEEELFGRVEVDSTVGGEARIAAPMHANRLSRPMRWLLDAPGRLRTECTGFGINLVSGNYEFASIAVIEDDDFWVRFGGDIEANWEAAGLRVYSSLDRQILEDLIIDESWSNEGLFAFLQGLRLLAEMGGARVDVPTVEWQTWTGSGE